MGVLDRGLDNVYFAPYQGRSSSTQETWGSPVVDRCVLEKVESRANSSDGTQLSISYLILTRTAHRLNDRCWVPGSDQTKISQSLLVKTITAVPVGASAGADSAVDHYEIEVGP